MSDSSEPSMSRPSASRDRRRLVGVSTLVAVAAVVIVAVVGLPVGAYASEASEVRYLSGTGYGDAVPWDFRCSEGRECGYWTTIAVPSQWELQGFGTYDYGYRDDAVAKEEGAYRHRFVAPETWSNRQVVLVFEGVMTDTLVRVNGVLAGAEHQGGFTRFNYDVTALLRFGEENLLEVRVRKHSANASVNRAEREADYWVFGGIYRPVYLRANPTSSVEAVAIDARHGGHLRVQVAARGVLVGDQVVARVLTRDAEPAGTVFAADVTVGTVGTVEVVLDTDVSGVRSWSAEDPVLYFLDVALERNGRVLHQRSERFGFRTIEVRPGAGLFVNDQRVLLKGVNRHAFWSVSGRTLNAAIDRRDVELLLTMNANAVRTSHYPPDPSFLDLCDELGLYVIDELPGWKEAYDTEVGGQLVRELVQRDRNHPSIVFWANGNEGGWNTELDDDFALHDFQHRPVLHPEAVASGIDTVHYPSYEELGERLEPSLVRRSWWRRLGRSEDVAPPPLVMPTEMLHGLYDGGGGTGLAEYWSLLQGSKLGVGGVLWSFFDEAVARGDHGWRLDTAGNKAPDGVVDVERIPEASFHTIRSLWSPVAIDSLANPQGEDVSLFDGALAVENRFSHTNLAACTFTWSWLRFPVPGGAGHPEGTDGPLALDAIPGGSQPGPPVAPGKRGVLRLPMPGQGLGEASEAPPDAVRLALFDSRARERMVWVIPLRSHKNWVKEMIAAAPAIGIVDQGAGGTVPVMRVGGVTVEIDRLGGVLTALSNGETHMAISGPVPVGEKVGAVASAMVDWALLPSGWLRLRYRQDVPEGSPVTGIRFAYPQARVRSVAWLGGGPSPVWRNRRDGPRIGHWSRVRNGAPRGSAPAFAGFYDQVYWAALDTDDGCLQIALGSDETALGLYNPDFGVAPETAVASLPEDGITVLHTIPAMGTKFHRPEALGPQGGRPEPTEEAGEPGTIEGVLWLRLVPRCDF